MKVGLVAAKEEEEEEEEDLERVCCLLVLNLVSSTLSCIRQPRPRIFVFNDTIEGPRAPAVKPGRVTQA